MAGSGTFRVTRPRTNATTAALLPIPSAIVSSSVRESPGLLASVRTEYLRSDQIIRAQMVPAVCQAVVNETRLWRTIAGMPVFGFGIKCQELGQTSVTRSLLYTIGLPESFNLQLQEV